MKAHLLRRLSTVLFAASISTAAVLNAATVFSTDFSTYIPGSLAGQPNWSFTNAGTHSWYVAEADTTNPQKPVNFDNHPASLSGDNLFWIAARTENLASTTNTARFAFTDTALQESFSVSLDIYVGPVSTGSGSSFNFLLTNGTLSAGPQIFLHGNGATGVGLRFTSGGTTEATLASNNWYRFEFSITPTSSSAGTWELTVYSLNSTGSIVSTVYSTEAGRSYSNVANGFDTLRFQTVSNRADYWIDSITVSTSTIPESRTVALLGGGLALVIAFGLRRR